MKTGGKRKRGVAGGKKNEPAEQGSNPSSTAGDFDNKEEKRQKKCLGIADGIDWLLGDMKVDTFKKVHFERKPLHMKRSSEKAGQFYEDFADLATPEAFFKLLDNGVVPVYRVNVFRCKDGSNKETPDPPPKTPADVRRLFREGWSCQWLQPQQEHDALGRLVSVLESQFGVLVGVNTYLTPPGTQGLAPHWDDVDVFVLQLSGKKSWRLHSSTSTSPLPPEAQTLPRFSSSDIPLDSLSPTMMEPVLTQGDLLYLPRGVIHHAPNQDRKSPSVHLTVSSFQRSTLYDLASKTVEEAMSELWETDESLRKCLPWGALRVASPAYPQLCSSVAELLRRVADAADAEAKAAAAKASSPDAAEAEGPSGCVAGALADLSADFVKHRMPPEFAKDPAEVEACVMVKPTSTVTLPDASVLALVPSSGDDDSSRLVHSLGNSRRNHMMTHPETSVAETDNVAVHSGSGSDHKDVDKEEEEEDKDEEEEQDEEEDVEEEDSDEDGEAEGQRISSDCAAALRQLCRSSPCTPLTSTNGDRAMGSADAQTVAGMLLKAEVPEASWPQVCVLLTQLAAVGLVKVGSVTGGKDASGPRGKKKRKQ
eukprot:TRINITY_DN24057_c0_g1_i1.p1 TRINITY_DN24057_c0_g1~~TRINITY_DN24057_c0_g1_i1.p1  ORF type:complete len:594 (-),score=141.97 TRINITY_DN24057_c0_g1_i1:183-1964(-)